MLRTSGPSLPSSACIAQGSKTERYLHAQKTNCPEAVQRA